jgi:4-hydroxybenzoate polyprenyltransferase
MLLAGLYTFRIFAGAAAADVRLSPWLLTFSMFFFLSLALGKRTIELARLPDPSQLLRHRGYSGEDAQILESLGLTSGYMAVLVFCLYIDADVVASIYSRPWMLWLICPILLHWISRFWLLARRRRIHDDPVVFALRDRGSLCSVALTALLVLLASA